MQSLGDKIISWARAEDCVELLVLIGSRTRNSAEIDAADTHSDWDFQIASKDERIFDSPHWSISLGLHPLAYVSRLGRLGSSKKVTAVFEEGELDLVVLPSNAIRALGTMMDTGEHSTNESAMKALTDQATVLQGGYSILKGGEKFESFFQRIVDEIPPSRLTNDEIQRLAEEFVCDYVSTYRKIGRGELLAAQRWLHFQLTEKNFRFLHEVRLREGLLSYPDARRLERLNDARMAWVAVLSPLTVAGLQNAVERTVDTFVVLIDILTDGKWKWPDLSPLRLRAK